MTSRNRLSSIALLVAACLGCEADPAAAPIDAAVTPLDQDLPADLATPDRSLPLDRGAVDMTPPVTDQHVADQALPGDGGLLDMAPPATDQHVADQALPSDQDVADQAPPAVDMAACADGAERPCAHCPATPQRCVGGQWQPCSGPAETCNGLDDDCDGATDEDYTPTATTCGVGACAAAGETACVAGAEVDGCTPGAPAEEVCDAVDNDCNGQIDDGLPALDWYPDPDGDGAFGPRFAQVQPSCAAWRATGARDDSFYPISPDGDWLVDVYCDMTTDGGGWTRVFHHDIAGGYWADADDALEHEVADPLALRYSILSLLDAFRSSDGHFDLRITWPDSGLPGRNIWRQTSDPTREPIAGYVAVEVDHADNGWGGLEPSVLNPATFLNGTVGAANWFYAIGSTVEWGAPPGIPSYGPAAAEVALWVRPDDPVAFAPLAEPISACGPIEGRAAEPGDCAPAHAEVHPGADERCDGIDNDCDGTIDEGFAYSAWYPDADDDGRGASAGTSCASLLAAGVVDDGVHRIRPAGPDGPQLDVYCDMTRDGGGWTRVFFHDIAGGYFRSDADAALRRAAAPISRRYSILAHLEHFRSSDGRFEMRIEWPNTGVVGRNIWRQTSNPTTEPIAGYEAIAIDHLSQRWGGLEPANRDQTWLNGSVGHANWFYSIGSQVPWNDPPGIPAAASQADRVALWVRPDDQRAGGPAVFACEAPAGFVAAAGDCDDTDPAISDAAEERCDGADNDCDGAVDEGCPVGGVSLAVMPQPLHFYARDLETNRCDFTIEGTTEGVAAAARVVVTRDGAPFATVAADGPAFAIPVAIDAGLHQYRIAVEWTDADAAGWRPAAAVDDVVCGDAFLIDGQSNAVAHDYHNERLGDRERDPFVRSFGSAARNAGAADDTRFGIAVADTGYTHGSIGQWGLRLANRVREAEQIPVLIINGAVGGTRVDQHQRNDADPTALGTIYGRLLWRARQAGVATAVRAIFWHQGESDGGLAYDTYLARWTAMYTDWLEDYPNVEGIFPFQVRAGCGNPTWNRNVHRDLPRLLPRVAASMSTTGVGGHDNCHFEHRTYAEWGERMARLVLRDIYDAAPAGNIAAPEPQSARWLSDTELEIDYGPTGAGLVLQDGARDWFVLSDGAEVVDAQIVGATVVLRTAAPSAAEAVAFVDVAGDIPWLVNDLRIGSFAYYAFPIDR